MIVNNINTFNYSSYSSKENKQAPSFGFRFKHVFTPERAKAAVANEAFNIFIASNRLMENGPLAYCWAKPVLDAIKAAWRANQIAMMEAQLNFERENKGFLPLLKKNNYRILRDELKQKDPLNTWRPLIAAIDTIGDKIAAKLKK